MRKRLAIIAVALLTAAPCFADQAGTHLELPLAPGSAWDSEPIAKVVFAEAYKNDVKLRMETSFAFGGPSDTMLFLTQDASTYRVVELQIPGLLSAYTPGGLRLGPSKPVDYRDFKPSRCSIDISQALAGRAEWTARAVLQKTRDDGRRRTGSDGENVFFSIPDRGRELRGFIWSPERNTEPGMLAAVMRDFQDACRTASRKPLENADADMSRLELRLAAGGGR